MEPPVAPVPPAEAPPLPVALDDGGDELALDELDAGAEAALELALEEAALDVAVLVVGVVVVVVVLVVVAGVGAAASAEVGIVSAGASAVSAGGGLLEPHPASASAPVAMSATGTMRYAADRPLAMTRIMKLRAAPSAARSGGSR